MGGDLTTCGAGGYLVLGGGVGTGANGGKDDCDTGFAGTGGGVVAVGRVSAGGGSVLIILGGGSSVAVGVGDRLVGDGSDVLSPNDSVMGGDSVDCGDFGGFSSFGFVGDFSFFSSFDCGWACAGGSADTSSCFTFCCCCCCFSRSSSFFLAFAS